jgi:ABC-2 type transport system permease protein
VVANTERKTIGVINTALRLFGGLDFQTMQSTPAWSVVEELRKQYEVVQITPDGPITEEVDGLLVALPSSLTQEQMDNVAAFIRQGIPTLLLLDPLPIVNLSLAPSEQPGANQNPFMRQQQPPPQPKGDIRSFLTELGFRWDPAMVTWDAYNPHPDLAHLPPEVVFLGHGNQNPEVFNEGHTASAQLQQLVLLYPGHIESASAEGLTYRPLLQSGAFSGRFPYFQMVQRSFLGAQLNRNLPHQPDPMTYTLAAEVQGAPSDGGESSEGETDNGDDDDTADGTAPLHVIAITDLDFVSEQFFEIRRIGPGNLNFDNVTFFLNSMDVLVGDESFVALRNRRVRHRTLERVENQTREFIAQRAAEESQAEMEAEQALAAAQRRLDEKVAEVRAREDLDDQTKQIMARNLEEVENRRLDVLKSNIDAEKEAEIRASEERMEAQIRRIQSGIRTTAVLLPPIPVFLLGVYIFIRRREREREGALAAHRLREGA